MASIDKDLALAILNKASSDMQALPDVSSPDVSVLQQQLADAQAAAADAQKKTDDAQKAAQAASDALNAEVAKEADVTSQLASAKDAISKADVALQAILNPAPAPSPAPDAPQS